MGESTPESRQVTVIEISKLLRSLREDILTLAQTGKLTKTQAAEFNRFLALRYAEIDSDLARVEKAIKRNGKEPQATLEDSEEKTKYGAIAREEIVAQITEAAKSWIEDLGVDSPLSVPYSETYYYTDKRCDGFIKQVTEHFHTWITFNRENGPPPKVQDKMTELA